MHVQCISKIMTQKLHILHNDDQNFGPSELQRSDLI